jgi:hypothetical protein
MILASNEELIVRGLRKSGKWGEWVRGKSAVRYGRGEGKGHPRTGHVGPEGE